MPSGSCRGCPSVWTGAKMEHCPSCHKTFSSTHSGDKHRTGAHEISTGPDRRRCLSTEEMEVKGMVVNTKGYWVSEASTREWKR